MRWSQTTQTDTHTDMIGAVDEVILARDVCVVCVHVFLCAYMCMCVRPSVSLSLSLCLSLCLRTPT